MKPKRLQVIILVVLTVLMLTGCDAAVTQPQQPLASSAARPLTGRDLRIVTGQTIYVPAYSEVFLGTEGLSRDLAVTLAIHNTDFDAPIFVQSVRYYDTDGNVVRDYIDDPVEVPPLATTGYLVEDGDRSGGWGSNFVVEWVAEEPVHEPIVEAFMVSTGGTHGISAISLGRVLVQSGES